MKKKILFILHLPPPVHGASTVGLYIKNSQFLNEAFEADYVNLATALTFEEIGKMSTVKITALLRIQWSVLRALMKKKYDLCYVSFNSHGHGFYKDFLIVILLKLFNKKIIYHFHNKGVALYQDRRIDNWLYQKAFRKTKSILLSQLLYVDIAKYVKKEDVYYCPNGIPDISGPTETEKRYKSQETNCRLLFVSNMYTAKGVFDLLRACGILRDKGCRFECHFVGAWSEITEGQLMQTVRENGLVNQIFAHGSKYGAEKYAFYQHADIFVFPSHNETFGLVILEAMQFALPVVATTVGGIPDVIINGETGFLVPPKDPVKLAEKLETLIQDAEARRKMGLAGKKRYHSFFTLSKFEYNLRQILEEAILN